jgi:hypothetical protein
VAGRLSKAPAGRNYIVTSARRALHRNYEGEITMSNDFRRTVLARVAAIGLVASSLAACAEVGQPRTASNGPLSGGSVDIVGGGGPQDDVARQIYHPGSGTDW